MGLKSIPNNIGKVKELAPITYWVGDIRIHNNSDKWVYTISLDGEFHVDIMKHHMDKQPNPIKADIIYWIHEISINVSCLVWRAKVERVPTATGLAKRGCNWMRFIVGSV